MQSETKIHSTSPHTFLQKGVGASSVQACQNCKQNFTIEPESQHYINLSNA